MSDELRTKLRNIADALADAADLLDIVREIAADMRSGGGEALEAASLKSSPQGELDVHRPDDVSDNDGNCRRDFSGDMVVPNGGKGSSPKGGEKESSTGH